MSGARRVDANSGVEPSSVVLTPRQNLQVPVASRESARVRVPGAPVGPRPPEGVQLTLVDGGCARALVPLTVLRECDWTPSFSFISRIHRDTVGIAGGTPETRHQTLVSAGVDARTNYIHQPFRYPANPCRDPDRGYSETW